MTRRLPMPLRVGAGHLRGPAYVKGVQLIQQAEANRPPVTTMRTGATHSELYQIGCYSKQGLAQIGSFISSGLPCL